jgi:hypothetical protein
MSNYRLDFKRHPTGCDDQLPPTILTFSLRTASTASSAKYSLSWERIFELSVVMAMFMRSDLNLSAVPMEVYCQKNIPGGILMR